MLGNDRVGAAASHEQEFAAALAPAAEEAPELAGSSSPLRRRSGAESLRSSVCFSVSEPRRRDEASHGVSKAMKMLSALPLSSAAPSLKNDGSLDSSQEPVPPSCHDDVVATFTADAQGAPPRPHPGRADIRVGASPLSYSPPPPRLPAAFRWRPPAPAAVAVTSAWSAAASSPNSAAAYLGACASR